MVGRGRAAAWIRRGWPELLLVGLLSIYVGRFVVDQADVFGDFGWMGDDTRQNAIPSYRYHGTGLFEDDLPTDYMEAFQPLGYRALFWVATLAFDPITFSNWLSLALTLAFLVFVVLAGRHVLPPRGPTEEGEPAGPGRGALAVGAVAAFLLLHDHEIPRWSAGGLPRSFAYPLTAAFLWAWLSGRRAAVLSSLVLAAAFYPTVFAYCAPAYGLSLLRLEPRSAERRWPAIRFDKRSVLLYAGAVFVALAFVYPQLRQPDERIGPVVTLEEAREMPELGRRGLVREVPFKDPGAQILEQVGGLFAPRGKPVWKAGFDWSRRHEPLVFLVLASLLLLLAPSWFSALPRQLFLLAGSALGVYAAARLFAFRLYIPGRILRFSLPVVAALAVPAAFALVVERATAARRWTAWGVSLALALLALLLLGDGRKPHNGIKDWSKRYPRVMSYLRTETARDTLVAGHPHLMNLVPCMALRPVYYNYETAMPYYKTYNEEMNRRARLLFDAFYAPDWEPLRKLRDEEGVDLFVVQSRYLGREIRKHDTWFHLTKYVTERAARLTPGSSPLLRPPKAAVLLRERDVTLIDLHRL